MTISSEVHLCCGWISDPESTLLFSSSCSPKRCSQWAHTSSSSFSMSADMTLSSGPSARVSPPSDTDMETEQEWHDQDLITENQHLTGLKILSKWIRNSANGFGLHFGRPASPDMFSHATWLIDFLNFRLRDLSANEMGVAMAKTCKLLPAFNLEYSLVRLDVLIANFIEFEVGILYTICTLLWENLALTPRNCCKIRHFGLLTHCTTVCCKSFPCSAQSVCRNKDMETGTKQNPIHTDSEKTLSWFVHLISCLTGLVWLVDGKNWGNDRLELKPRTDMHSPVFVPGQQNKRNGNIISVSTAKWASVSAG